MFLSSEKRKKSRPNGNEKSSDKDDDKNKDDSNSTDDKSGSKGDDASDVTDSKDDDVKSVEELDDDDDEDYMDDNMQREDSVCRHDITTILNDHRRDILNYIPPPSRSDIREKKMSKVQSKLAALSGSVDIAGTPSSTVRKVRGKCYLKFHSLFIS